MVINVTMEIVRAMKVRSSADENTTCKPFRAIVTVGSASIRSGVIVAIRAIGGASDVNADTDLSRDFGSGNCEAKASNSGNKNIFKPVHK